MPQLITCVKVNKAAFSDPSLENIWYSGRGESAVSHICGQNDSGNQANIAFAVWAFMKHLTFPLRVMREARQLYCRLPLYKNNLQKDRKASFSLAVLFHTKKTKWLNNSLFGFIFGKCCHWKYRTNQWHLWWKFIAEECPWGVISEE